MRSIVEILFLTSEAVPFAKTGGLADVCGSLPTKLADRGHRVAVLLPAFADVHRSGMPVSFTDISFAFPIGGKLMGGRLLTSVLPDSDVPVYFIDQPRYFDRPRLYGDDAGDYRDNCERFAFFSRACLHAITRLGWSTDIVHCNDWQTGLVPAYMALGFESHPWMANAASVMTIHNLAYQGQFWAPDLPLTGLGWEHFHPSGLEFYGHLNLLKAGIVYADSVSTVSPRYAQEIQTPEHGCGLEGVLRERSDSLVGIINGIDPMIWDPATDPDLEARYDADEWREGKAANKRVVQQQFGLPEDGDRPLIGLVGRLAEQKGWDLVLQVMQWWLDGDSPAQWIVLGNGQPQYHEALSDLAGRYPGRVGLHLGYSERLAHRIEAASDIFAMPSRYEPCGLNQLYSLRYGAIPVVNPTGGLADTVVDATDGNLQRGVATGFHMTAYSAEELSAALGRAVAMRSERPDFWNQMVVTAMRQDWSWRRSAVQYEQLYADTLSRRKKSRGK